MAKTSLVAFACFAALVGCSSSSTGHSTGPTAVGFYRAVHNAEASLHIGAASELNNPAKTSTRYAEFAATVSRIPAPAAEKAKQQVIVTAARAAAEAWVNVQQPPVGTDTGYVGYPQAQNAEASLQQALAALHAQG